MYNKDVCTTKSKLELKKKKNVWLLDEDEKTVQRETRRARAGGTPAGHFTPTSTCREKNKWRVVCSSSKVLLRVCGVLPQSVGVQGAGGGHPLFMTRV